MSKLILRYKIWSLTRNLKKQNNNSGYELLEFYYIHLKSLEYPEVKP